MGEHECDHETDCLRCAYERAELAQRWARLTQSLERLTALMRDCARAAAGDEAK